MENPKLYPLLFKPIYKPYIWGGRNLEKIGKVIPKGQIVAESWEISDHGEDVSIVANGPLKRKTLHELVQTYGEDISPPTKNGRFPILIKFIDANRRLSVQVHPDDEYAMTHESPDEMGKTECWYIMSAPPGAKLIMGLKEGYTRESFEKMLRDGKIEETLNWVEVKKGDVLFIKTGTVHALIEGIMVCEIQQNSDTTYRLYDWGRVGPDGKPRPLHIEKALDVINFASGEEWKKLMNEIIVRYSRATRNRFVPVIRNRYFNIDYGNLNNSIEIKISGEYFHTLSVLKGKGTIKNNVLDVGFKAGDTLLIPGQLKKYIIQPETDSEEIEILKSFL